MITGTNISSSSSSSFSSSSRNHLCPYPYEVFLTFRDEDTGAHFADHLYGALKEKGIITFKLEEEGNSVVSKLSKFKAIEESKYVIVLLSRNYAFSTSCLDELAKAVECNKLMMGQTLLPIFYHIHPSEVRKQRGNFEKALSQHEQASQSQGDIAKVKRWRAALSHVAGLSGWHLQHGYESELIQTVVGKIFMELNQTISSAIPDLVGMDSRAKEMLSYLQIGSDKVRVVGIWGMGGMGKTTIAQVVSERIKNKFGAYSFLANVREVTEKQGIVELQKKLVSDILLESHVNIQNPEMGIRILSQRLRTKKVLIVLDDVGHVEQLKALCGRKTWFGSGSKIIITARDERLLIEHEVDEKYQVKPLTDEEALQLFIQKSFKGGQVGQDFFELCKNFLIYVDGFPLAIEVLGSSLFSRNKEEWSSALDRLKENPDKTIINVLKVSYDGLLETEKKVFLDIACFFKGEDKHRVTRILESCFGYRPVLEIKVLMENCLLTPVGRKLWMHDMIQELGWEIVRLDSPEEVGNRSRLWLPHDITHVLENNLGTTAVQSILLNLPKEKEVNLNVNNPFLNMDKLRLLKIRNGNFSGDIKYLSSELALMEWHSCPLNTLPSNYESDRLVELSMHSSRIKHLWKGKKRWRILTFIDMSHSQYLTKTPDFTKVPNLEKLVLQDCIRLVEVHPSIGVLKKLVFLDMRNCKSVESLPHSISLESLQSLRLSACSRFKKFPEIEGNMKSLIKLYLDGTAIEELPPSIERLTGLTLLNLGDCKNLLFLPSTIQCLTSLKSLILTGCSELDGIPENLNCVECLEELDISGTAIRESSFIVGMKNLKYISFRGCKDLPSKPWQSLFNCWWWGRKGHAPMSLLLPTSLSALTSLTNLNLSDCNLMEGGVPDDIGSLASLKMLNLSGNNFVSLPGSLFELSKLRELDVSNCSRLQSLPKKFQYSLLQVNARDCTSLRDLQNQVQVMSSEISGTTTINTLISSKNVDNGTRKYTTSASPMTGFSIESEHQCEPHAFESSQSVHGLLKQLEGWTYQSAFHSIVGVGYKIPKWFGNAVSRNSIEIPIPPDLKEDKTWMGVAAVFTLKQHDRAMSYIESDLEASNYFFKCVLSTNEFKLSPYFFRRKQCNFVRSGSHLLCVFYHPCVHFPAWLNESSAFVASFETNHPYMVVQEFGIRLVYQQDVTRYIEALLSCYDVQKYQIIPSDDCIKQPAVDKAAFDSGWVTLEDNMLRREKAIPAFEEEGSVILARRNIESLLQRYLKGQISMCERYCFAVSGSPAWFNPQRGSSVSIQVPQNLGKSKKWMGFAFCVSLAVDTKECHYDLSFELTSENFEIKPLMHCENTFDKHQLWVFYYPMVTLSSERCIRSSSSRMVSILFRTHNLGVKVQICGLRILYQQDLQGYVQAFIRCIFRSSSNALFHYYNDMVVKKWIDFIQLQQSHNKLDSEGRTGQRIYRHTGMGSTYARKYEGISLDFRHRDWPVTQFTCSFPGIKIPKWFGNLYRSGTHARIQVPPNLYDDSNWLGIAVCAYFSVHHAPDSEVSHPALVCELLTNVASVRICGAERTNEAMWMDACGFTWFIYLPRALFSSSLNQCDRICAILTSSNPDVRAHECARRLVFKEDVDDLVDILTLCSLKAGSSPFSSSIVFSNNQDQVFKANPHSAHNMKFARPAPPSILEISISV